MMKNLLVEIGLEELPAYTVTPSMIQLKDRMSTFLTDNRLSFESIDMFSTPRRLAVRVHGLADFQTDLTEDFKGPSKKIALDDSGQFTKAAEGFVRGKGLTTADITFREIKGEEYVYVTKHEKGLPAQEVLQQIPSVLKAMSFPVSMRWGNHSFDYIRPVHTFSVLLDDEALDMTFLDVPSGRISRGHRFLGKEVRLSSADRYESELEKEFVIADATRREQMIREQIRAIEDKEGVFVDISPDLLNEVLNLVEYPTAFMGHFDAKYLDLPEEVLVTSMTSHQRYFVVRDKDGKLLPHFISVRNGNAEFIDNVIKGNEKVLVARIEDGEFFWREDQKLAISDLVERLKTVTFHEKIGSLYEHMMRTTIIADKLAELADFSQEEREQLARAARIYKFDLLTGMVGEFDELQGIMGEKYARLAGEDAAVATAIREHYLPNSADGELPQTKVGAILAVADKLDTLLSFFTVGLIPSGSNDTYALRRATQGIVRILEAFGWEIPLSDLVDLLYELSFESLVYDNKEAVQTFIKARIEKMMPKDISKHIISAVLASSTTVVSKLLETAQILNDYANRPEFKPAVESLTRVFNLAEKATTDQIDTQLFENEAESRLYEAVEELELTDNVEENITNLFALSPLITDFFEGTMVMTEDEALRRNRLALLKRLTEKATTIAAFNLIITK